ncbi:peptidase S41 [Flavobacterium sp. Sd200]|uniref:S41 family peptidase n=1 Tax=Flavobacterium sp. Sd200 TaxID=2692211 RepID=UPI001370F0F0|nr:S41 family peptidase [Flavobacterium sp. Sd200]MXN91624.1 peptidase S41 [Flavobacterium sp. Sd200]
MSYYSKSIIFILAVFALILGCRSSQPDMSAGAQAYLEEVITLLKTSSVNRNTIDWDNFTAKVTERAKNAKTVADTYDAVAFAVAELGDHHSYFAPNIAIAEDAEKKELPVYEDEAVPQDIGYIRLPFCIGNEQQTQSYIGSILKQISERDKANLKGWIVDLRGNFGGNMWPMIVAVGPILGNGTVGYFIDANGKAESWKYADGKSYANDVAMEQYKEVYHLKISHPYVAVLTDTLTASSGEAMAVAFKGRPKTKSFGFKTYGVSTANQSYTLSDGSRINLTQAIFADRDKKSYGKSVLPDVECNPSDAVNQAIVWLQSH